MAFSLKQTKLLQARLKRTDVRTRHVDGKSLQYIEGWYAVAEANRIFGFEGWDRETVSSQCVWQKVVDGRAGSAYVTRVRITVRAGETTITREGLGSSEAYAQTPGQAHERAAKAAETDATKRALSTFGNRFGLSLYGEKQGIRGPLTYKGSAESEVGDRTAINLPPGPRPGRKQPQFKVADDNPPDLAPSRDGITSVYISSPTNVGARPHNLETSSPTEAANNRPPESGHARFLPVTVHTLPPTRMPIDKSELPIGEPKRLRSPDHLRFVARQACLICKRQPSQAHHLRYAQPRALSRKVSDEFAVPLCPFHHDEVHRTGNEFQWWRKRGIDPLHAARDLWRETRTFPGAHVVVETEEILNKVTSTDTR